MRIRAFGDVRADRGLLDFLGFNGFGHFRVLGYLSTWRRAYLSLYYTAPERAGQWDVAAYCLATLYDTHIGHMIILAAAVPAGYQCMQAPGLAA